jgi:hypothetical protein
MSSKYKTGKDAIPHFITFTVVGWINVFSREPTGASVQPKVGHWCLLVQAVCDRSMVQPKKIMPQIKSL